MKESIKKWIMYEGGILDTGDNHFGGESDSIGKSRLNLKIQQRPGELASLVELLINLKKSGERLEYYAEIGACSGGTTYTINNFLNFKELLIIDDGGAQSKDYVDNRGDQLRGQNLGFIPRIEIIGSSAEERVIEIAKNISNIRKYDVLFIDGDHSYEGVKNDTINYESIVRIGGYIIFHDTAHIPDIKNWVEEALKDEQKYKLVSKFEESDPHTNYYTNGIGLTIIQKIK